MWKDRPPSRTFMQEGKVAFPSAARQMCVVQTPFLTREMLGNNSRARWSARWKRVEAFFVFESKSFPVQIVCTFAPEARDICFMARSNLPHFLKNKCTASELQGFLFQTSPKIYTTQHVFWLAITGGMCSFTHATTPHTFLSVWRLWKTTTTCVCDTGSQFHWFLFTKLGCHRRILSVRQHLEKELSTWLAFSQICFYFFALFMF